MPDTDDYLRLLVRALLDPADTVHHLSASINATLTALSRLTKDAQWLAGSLPLQAS